MEANYFEDGGYRAKFNILIGIMNEHGLRSDRAKNYLCQIVEEEGEEFRDQAITVAALKLKFPEGKTFEELMELARRKFGDPFTPPEVAGLDSYLSEMFGRDSEQDEENDAEQH